MSDSSWMPPDPNRPQPQPETVDPAHTEPTTNAAATEIAPPSPWSNRSPDGPETPPTPGIESIVEPVTSEPGRGRRSKLLVGGAVVAVLAVGAAGIFAVTRMTGNASGGAASPSELGQQVLTAIDNEDVLGLIDTLAPGERDALGDPLIEIVSEMTRLEVLSPDTDLANIAGLDIVLADQSVRTEATNVDDIVNMALGAQATVTVDGSAVPIGDLLVDNLPAEAIDEVRGSTETTTESFDFPLTAIEVDGSWYVSVFHTAAEQIRGDMEPTPDIPVDGLGATGGDSPEAALDALLDSVEQLNLSQLIQSLNPGEAAALQRYAPLFLDEAQAELDDAPLEWTITDRQFDITGDGDQRTAQVVGLTITGTFGDESGSDEEGLTFTVSWRDQCITAEFEGETFDQCLDDVGASTLDDYLDDAVGDAPATVAFIEALQESLSDMETPGIELRQTDGQWYVSPIGTYSEVVLKVLRALDRQELDRLIDIGQSAVNEFEGTIFGTDFDDMVATDDFTTDDFTTDDFTTDDMFSSDDSFASDETFSSDDSFASDAESAVDACYIEPDPAVAAACFEAAIVIDGVDASWIPVELRFLECGYAETSWGGAIYELPDEQFMAAVAAAAPCFDELLASGQVSEWELPYEFISLECFEGRNWYAVLDDPDYDDRVWDCIFATSADSG